MELLSMAGGGSKRAGNAAIKHGRGMFQERRKCSY